MPLSVKMIERNNKKKTPKAAQHKLPGKSSLNFSFVFPVCPVCPAHDHHGRHDRHNHHDIINHHTHALITINHFFSPCILYTSAVSDLFDKQMQLQVGGAF